MKPRFSSILASAALALSASTSALASTTLVDLAGPVSGVLASPNTVTYTFNSPVAASQALVEFKLNLLNTIDGNNYYVDIFTFGGNGAQTFSATLGTLTGGGDNLIVFDTGTTLVSKLSDDQGVAVYFVSTLLDLHAGSNTLTFNYDSPFEFLGTSRAGPQGTGDEAWQLGSLKVTVASNVPEPSTWALAGAGLVIVAAGRRARRPQQG